MHSIENISIIEYFNLTTDEAVKYDIYADTINPINLFCDKVCNTSNLTYDEVKVIEITFRNPTLEDIKDLFIHLYDIRGDINISSEQIFYNESIFQWFRVNNFIKNWIKDVINKERKVLSGIPDDKMVMLNASERLSSVSHLLNKIKLAEQFSTTPAIVGGWKYSIVFSYLVANHKYNEIQTEYSQMK